MCSRNWLIVTLVACGLASACSQYNTNLSIQTSSSSLSFVSPGTVTAGAQGFTITANGAGFVSGALILWNGKALNTTLVSSVQLTAAVPASLVATPGTAQLAVQIPGSAQSGATVNNTTTTEISNSVYFTISPVPGAPPSITSLSASATSPNSTPYCNAQGFVLTVNGTNFTSDTLVNWNGTAQSTTFKSATLLTAAIPASDTALLGTAVVTVANSLGTSNSLPLTISTPVGGFPTPTLTSITPNSAPAGAGVFPAFTITAQGTNILPCTLVQWVSSNNVTTTLPTTYVPPVAATLTSPATPPSLIATVPASDLASLGMTNLNLINPGSQGSLTNVGFTIVAPTITSLSSSATAMASTPACSPPGVTLTVTGTNFVTGSVVDWIIPPPMPSGTAMVQPLATTFVSSTKLIATLPASDIASPGMVNIQVTNLGVLSNMSPFTISTSTPPAPTNISISQTSATAGAAAFPLTVNGTNLLPCSVVQWTKSGATMQLRATYVSPTQTSPAQLIATVPAANIASVGMAFVTVVTPGANTSAPVSFAISLATITSLSASTSTSTPPANNAPYCSSSGFTLTVNGTGFANGLVVNWNGLPRPTTLVSATQLTAAISASDTASLATGAAAVAITVSGGNPATNSNSLKFSLTPLPTGTALPMPSISRISPQDAAVEALTGPPVALTVTGSSLFPCSAVQWNGAPLPTTIFIGTGGIASFIPAANITTTASALVTVATPGTASSNGQTFTPYTPGSPSTTNLPGGSLSLPLMSSTQRYGVFVLASSDGKTETPGTIQNVFVSDTCHGVTSGCTPSTTLVSAGTTGTTGNGDSISPSINADSAPMSPDGRYVAFLSSATNLVPGGTNGLLHAFVRDTCAGVASGCTPSTQLVSVSTGAGGTQANGPTTSATIDATGRYVTFESAATNLGASLSTPSAIYVRDTCTGGPSGCVQSTFALN